MAAITLPYNWTPRPYQRDLMAYLDANPQGRAACVWHRRAGKDTASAHQLCKSAHRRVGTYWHVLPTQRQGRKVVWDSYTREGTRFLDAVFPPPIRARDPNSTEMKVPLKCGSTYQVVGSDQYDALVGSNPIGVVFSEWSLTNPRAWDYIRPILRENGGWAAFIYTPRGYNHGWDTKQIAESTPGWFYSFKTIHDTGVLTQKDLDDEIRAGMPEELVRQEFLCDFSAANVGAILGKYIEQAERDGRINDDVYPAIGEGEIICVLDIGFRDATACWWFQQCREGYAALDYREESGADAADWIDFIKTSRYPPNTVYLPHDARAKTFRTKFTVLDEFLHANFETVRIVPRVLVLDKVNAARSFIQSCWFHKTLCAEGLQALRSWQYTWDEDRKVFSKEPEHNWASHGSDAFAYAGLALGKPRKATPAVKTPQELAREAVTAHGFHYAMSLNELFEDRARTQGRRL